VTKDTLPAILGPAPDSAMVLVPPTDFTPYAEGVASPVTFEAYGDSFTGLFRRIEQAADDKDEIFNIAIFSGTDGEPYSINLGAYLARVMPTIALGTWCRITYKCEVELDPKKDPMKSFTVDIA
jgi:hypothetical protein